MDIWLDLFATAIWSVGLHHLQLVFLKTPVEVWFWISCWLFEFKIWLSCWYSCDDGKLEWRAYFCMWYVRPCCQICNQFWLGECAMLCEWVYWCSLRPWCLWAGGVRCVSNFGMVCLIFCWRYWRISVLRLNHLLFWSRHLWFANLEKTVEKCLLSLALV